MAYTQYLLSDLLSALAVKYESVPFWTQPEAIAALNESFRVWNMLTGVWKDRITVTTPTDHSPWIEIPLPLFYNVRMEWTADGRPLGRSSIGDLDNGRPNWEGETTLSGGDVPTSPKHFAPAGLNMFAIWPQDYTGGNTITVDGVVNSPTLSSLTDTVDINPASLQAILGYALHYLAFKESGQRWKATSGYYREFLLAAIDQNDRLSSSAMFRKAAGLDVNRGQRPLRSGKAAQQKQQG